MSELETKINSRQKLIPLSNIELNEGQIEGLPANPRQIDEQQFEKLKANMTAYPEMLEYRGLLVYPYKGKYVVIGGNMRYRAMLDLSHTEAPCVVLPEESTAEQLRSYVILDNDNFGRWNWDMLANEWEMSELSNFGLDIIGMSGDIDDLFEDTEGSGKSAKEEKITVTIPEELADQKQSIMDNIKSILAPYNGLKIR